MSLQARQTASGDRLNENPFSTPSRTSLHSAQNTDPASIGSQSGAVGTGTWHEMQDGAANPSATAQLHHPRSSFFSRWRQADEHAYLATVGRVLPSRARNNEKAEHTAPERRRAPAGACTIISAVFLLIVIIVIVVPVAVVYSNRNSGDGTDNGGNAIPSSPGSGPAPIPNSNIVSLKQGQYRGTVLPNGITQFLGMQYAAPPTGDLRFAPPQSPVQFDGIKAATRFAPACHGLGDFMSSQNEDCLYLDVYTPTNTTNQSKLPVFFFTQGGGLQDAADHFNGSSLVTASGFQMITVTFTYRVNAFGFLASSELEHAGCLNVGLKDQRMALQWVQNNIAAFGGDPSRVVLAGQSGGAGIALMQTTAYGGRDDKLFRAVALQSQSLQAIRDVSSSQFQYDYIVGNTSCADSKDTLACLRQVSPQGMVHAIQNSPFPDGAGGDPVFPYNPVIDGDILPLHPIAAYEQGKFVNVPIIFGDDEDEGTIFVPKDISTQQDANDFLRNTYPLINNTVLKEYATLYNLSDTTDDNYWRNVAAAYGETRYTCPGLQLTSIVQKAGGKAWYYNYDVADPNAEAADLGVKHSSEVTAIFGPGANSPVSYKSGGENSGVVPLMQAYWTSFIKNLDPNTDKLDSAPTWDQWTGNNWLHVVANATAIDAVDSDLAKRCGYLNSIATNIGQ